MLYEILPPVQAGVPVRDLGVLCEARGGAAGQPGLGPARQHSRPRDAESKASAE